MSEMLSIKELKNNKRIMNDIKNFIEESGMEDLPQMNDDLEIIYYSNAGVLLHDYFTNISFESTPIEELTNEMAKVNYDIGELIKTCFNDYMFRTNENEFIEIVVVDW